MKRYSLYIISIFLICFSSGCVDDSLIDDAEYKGKANIRVFTTTPEAEIAKLETKAAHENDLPAEAKVNSLIVLVFEDATDGAELLQMENVNMANDYDGTVKLSGKNNVHIRLVANYNLPDNLKGKTWSEIRTSHIYNVDNSDSQSFPMTADIPNFNIKPNNHIGKSDDRVKLVRAMAKITLNIDGNGSFKYVGNKIHQIEKQGYLFAQDDNNLTSPTTSTRYNETEYNKRKVTYSPERKNTGKDQKTPLDTRTYVLIEGTYNGVKSFYRVDFGSRNSSEEMEYVDFKRNTNYWLKVNIVNYGFATEEEAIAAPVNSDIIEVSIVESSAYELLVDESGHYLGVSNSAVAIFGKSQYMSDGFEGVPQDYSYVFTTITNEKTSGWNENDIEIISVDGIEKNDLKIVVVDKLDEDGNPIAGMKEYLLTGKITSIFYESDQFEPHENELPGSANVSIRYGRLVKDITILRYRYLDCPFGNKVVGQVKDLSVATIKKHRMADGNFFEKPVDWAFFKIGGGNCASTDYGNSENQAFYPSSVGVAADFSIVYREHLDGSTMGVKSANAKYEGFRFVDAYFSQIVDGVRYKMILAQANADLSGYFGRESHFGYEGDFANVGAYEVDDGNGYDSYLVSNRIYGNDPTCTHLNPRHEYLWYNPSNRQLIGLWLTDNSNSRKANSATDPVNPPLGAALYIGTRAGGYTKAQHNYYYSTGKWDNELRNTDIDKDLNMTYNQLFTVERNWFINFLDGESTRKGSSEGTYYRCVRRLPHENMPEDIRRKVTTSPVSGKQVTMDPAGYLSEDYFNQEVANPIARKIEVQPKVSETDQTTIYTANGTGWKQTTKNIEKEYTLANAYAKATVGDNRLPTQRELLMIYVYHDLLVNAGMEPFYKDEADGYYEGTGTSAKPNRLLYKMYRYPAPNHDAYLHWYWTSTTDKGQFTGNDNGTVIPHRVSFHFGDVNRRGDKQTTSMDHYRAVKTIQKQ